MSDSFDAVVVGAGLAGAIASRELQFRGLRTVLLEGRDRLGGRAWSTDFRGLPIEMGGQNVFWSEPHIWSEITRYGLQIAEVKPFETFAVAEGGTLTTYPASEALQQLGRGFELFFGDYGLAMPRPYEPNFKREEMAEIDRMSIQDRLDQIDLPPESARWLNPWLTMRSGGSPDQAAFAWILHIYALAEYDWRTMLAWSSRFRLVEGIGTLVRQAIEDGGAEVRLDANAVKIEDDGARVAVTTAKGDTVTGKVCVVATSGNMWSRIDFASGLSQAKQAASQQGLQTPNAFIKLWAIVRGKVDNLYVQRPNHREHPIIHLRKDMDRPDGTTQILAFSIDRDLDVNDHGRIAQLFRETAGLDDIEVIDVKAQNWVADPLTQGGTSLLRPGMLTRLDELQRPEGRLTFATADISNATPGFDGAIERGIVAARQAVDIARAA